MTIPLVRTATVFNAIAASATKELGEAAGNFGQLRTARSIHLEINGGDTPNWTLDIQGRVDESATWHNIDYFRTDQGAAVTPSVSQLTVNWTTAQHYVIPNPPPFVRLVGTRTGGTLTVYASFSSEAYSVPFGGPGTGATSLGKAEDAAHTSSDVGVMALGVRNDSGATTYSGANGDYTPIAVTDRGQVQVSGPVPSDTALAVVGGPVITGGRASAATPTAVNADGDAVWAWMTRDGAAVTAPYPAGLTGTSPSNDVSAAAEASSVVKASVGTLYDFTVNSSAAGFIQFHNSASLPADTAVPFLTYPIAANETISPPIGPYGKRFSTGIVIAYSTTQQTLTIGGAVMLANVGYV